MLIEIIAATKEYILDVLSKVNSIPARNRRDIIARYDKLSEMEEEAWEQYLTIGE